MSWRSQADLWAPDDFHFDLPADQATLFPSNLPGFDSVSFQLPEPVSSSTKPPISREVNGGENSMRLKAEEPRLPKVPIPRATNQMNAVTPGRVKQECQSCREQKVKCSGHRPECRRCEENSFSCVYEDRKRFKMIKQLDNLANQVQTYESLLREIYPKLGFEVANSVDHVFGYNFHNHRPLEKDILSSSKHPAHVFHETDCHDDSNASFPAVVADCTTEDYNQKRENLPVKYVGDHSLMKWLYRLKCHLDDTNRNSDVQEDSYDNFDRGKLSSVYYYLDDVKLRFPEDVDISQRPPQAIADHLISAYFGVTHVYFPSIRKEIFLSQYRSFYSDQTAKPGRRWLAIFNLILAVAAGQPCAMSKESLPEFPENQKGNAHSTFFGRGWSLALTDSLLEPSDLQQVQVEALASLYLLSVGHANRLVILILSIPVVIMDGA
ncbi:C6 transcription factor [Penicillium canescens]|uniref:C6 transcription factor n=1 Tax=Penicillium canescens TaxID=5083 RepID=UPI0026E01791|nr:C6 transcription factor [Penicillium canescens]KAJ6045440.1 C6 transcription factor [Penicillium canescens]